jgi:hypothetical protein
MTPEEQQTDTRRRLNDITHAVTDRLPEHFGFFVLVFPFGDGEAAPHANYVSNAKREDVINVMKEWLIKCGAEEDWMKQIK